MAGRAPWVVLFGFHPDNAGRHSYGARFLAHSIDNGAVHACGQGLHIGPVSVQGFIAAVSDQNDVGGRLVMLFRELFQVGARLVGGGVYGAVNRVYQMGHISGHARAPAFPVLDGARLHARQARKVFTAQVAGFAHGLQLGACHALGFCGGVGHGVAGGWFWWRIIWRAGWLRLVLHGVPAFNCFLCVFNGVFLVFDVALKPCGYLQSAHGVNMRV